MITATKLWCVSWGHWWSQHNNAPMVYTNKQPLTLWLLTYVTVFVMLRLLVILITWATLWDAEGAFPQILQSTTHPQPWPFHHHHHCHLCTPHPWWSPSEIVMCGWTWSWDAQITWWFWLLWLETVRCRGVFSSERLINDTNPTASAFWSSSPPSYLHPSSLVVALLQNGYNGRRTWFLIDWSHPQRERGHIITRS